MIASSLIRDAGRDFHDWLRAREKTSNPDIDLDLLDENVNRLEIRLLNILAVVSFALATIAYTYSSLTALAISAISLSCRATLLHAYEKSVESIGSPLAARKKKYRPTETDRFSNTIYKINGYRLWIKPKPVKA
jgi:hypothetical protein